jgi:hypothetical protein
MSLPSNWTSAPILTCGTFIRGVTYKKQEASTTTKPGYARILRANNISTRNISTEEIIYVPLKNISETQILQSGDILIATSSGSPSVVGKAAQIKNDTDMSFGAFCGVIRPHRDLNPEYIGHFFSSKQYRDRISKLARGTNINNIKQEHFESIKIPLAPINEQHRIADKLDRMLARVDTANEHLSRAAPLIKRFRQSVLAAATSGRLTEDWRGKETNWNTATIGQVLADIRYGTAKKCSHDPKGTAVLRIPNIGNHGRIELSDLKYAEFTQKEYESFALRPGDLLLIRSNGSVDLVGKTSVVDKASAGLLFAGYLIRLRIQEDIALPSYIQFALSSPMQRQRVESIARSTSGVNNINTEEVRSLPFHLPPIEEQSEIVRRVEKLFAFADRLEERLSQAQTAVQKLTPALLAKAFRGELAPQDPNDEPASELLKRLQESRTESTKPSRARKPRARKSP